MADTMKGPPPIELHPWERPIGDPLHVDRDVRASPYDRQEQRAAKFLWDAGFGGGDDPIGFLITSARYSRAMQLRAEAALQSEREAAAAETRRTALLDYAQMLEATSQMLEAAGSSPRYWAVAEIAGILAEIMAWLIFYGVIIPYGLLWLCEHEG